MVQISGENSKLFPRMRSGRVRNSTSLSPPLSKDEGLRNIEHSMSTGNLIWGGSSATVSYLIRYDSLLQNTTAILLQKCDIGLLQNASGFL